MQADYAALRAELARLLHEAPDALDPDENLVERGLDSMRLMTLFMAMEADGTPVDFGMVLERPTLNGIWAAAGQATRRDESGA